MARDTKMLQAILETVTNIRADVKELSSVTKKTGRKIDNLTESLRYLAEKSIASN